jgi:DNA-binding response OmpR family regulator
MENTTYQIGEVQFNPMKQVLIFNRFRSVKLSHKESLILQYMMKNTNKAITLSEIISQCLVQYQCDPLSTRRAIQQLSTKLELADHIEYPYIDCYMFHASEKEEELPSIFNFKRIKKLFSRTPHMTKLVAG